MCTFTLGARSDAVRSGQRTLQPVQIVVNLIRNISDISDKSLGIPHDCYIGTYTVHNIQYSRSPSAVFHRE